VVAVSLKKKLASLFFVAADQILGWLVKLVLGIGS
jgi:hypothetical protein